MKPLTPEELSIKYSQLSDPAKEDLCTYLAKWAEVERPAIGDTGTPRRTELTHRATGRLIFSCDSPDGEKLPLHNVRVELWDRDFGPDDFLGTAATDREGYFEIWYDPADAGLGDTPDLELRVFDWEHAYNNRRERELRYNLVALFPGRDDVVSEHFNFGELRVAYWEYDPQAVTPRILVPEHSNPPQSFPAGRAVVLLQQLAGIQLTKEKHWLENKLDPQRPSLATIQADYPESLSMQIEKERPGYTRSDEYFGERILNGMSASILDRDPSRPDRLWLHHHWNSYAQDDVHAMPNVDVWFELRDGRVYPVEIGLQFRQRGHTEPNSPQEPMQRFTPADGDRWLQAKRVARVSAALHAELDVHLCQTHLNTEQYALAAYRNLRLSPVRYLLHPHLKEVILINREANQRLLGENGYITRATAFTAESLNQRIRQSVGMLDWKHWQPRRILSEHHQYARAAHLFWDVLTEYVHWFFEEHREAIVEHWYEVYRFSRDLVSHSAPFSCAATCAARRRLIAGQPTPRWATGATPANASTSRSPAWSLTGRRKPCNRSRCQRRSTRKAGRTCSKSAATPSSMPPLRTPGPTPGSTMTEAN